MMKSLCEGIKEMDVFSHNQFLRYRKQQNYRTLTGGIISISIFIFFFSIFTQLIIKTLNQSIILSKINRTYQINPSLSEVIVSPEKQFNFAFGLLNLNMNSKTRYFDIVFQQNAYSTTTGINSSSLETKIFPLLPCQKQEWSGINAQIQKSYDNLKLNEFLCIPSGSKLNFQGRWTSEMFRIAQIKVNKCSENNTLYPGTRCATEAQIQDHLNRYGDFSAAFYYVNTLLDPQNEKYFSYYLQDKNVVFFNTHRGAFSDLYFSEYHIFTDNSIFPWQSITEKQGIYVENKMPYHQTYGVTHDNYFLFSMIKADITFQAQRSYRKMDQSFSYIGGLYGAITSFLIIVSLYDKYSYQIQFGDRIFKQNNKKSYGSQHFNFAIFLLYSIFNIFSKLGVINWKVMKKYHECRLECIKQLDINLLFKKIQFFQQISSVILQEHHFVGLHLIPKKTISESAQNREKYLIQGLIYNQLDKKAQQINVQPAQYRTKYEKFMSNDNLSYSVKEQFKQNCFESDHLKATASAIQQLSKLNSSSVKGDRISQNIMKKFQKNKQLEPFLDLAFKIVNNILHLEPNKTLQRKISVQIIEDIDQQIRTQSAIMRLQQI